ncbi:MAG TPA: prepilin-type N-terminal cleavage/methylation domain-containing protein [Gemmatimonadaceae bacterium]|nr:prepilin-type N-terminal cleavage/methylation domain-containing protein [Gemmatimonadaceae bacterium]
MITLRRRSGLTIIELLVTVIVLGIVGGGIVRMLTSQARFYEHQGAGRSARSVSRAAVNVLLSEMRMVDGTQGVIAATSSSVTLRVPYTLGVYCGSVGGVATVALLPTDSAMLAEPGFTGYAWRGRLGPYNYVEAGAGLTAPVPGQCIAAGLNPVPGSVRIGLTPVLPVGVDVGVVVMLTRRTTYFFAGSAAVPGRVALWRQVDATGVREELAAPFDATSRFRFYRLNDNTAQDAVPVLNEIRGFELVLTGASESTPRLTGGYQRSALTTSVFFRNRL